MEELENKERHYNREQRRRLKKRLGKGGLSVDDAIRLFEARLKAAGSPALEEGTKVRLNYESITSRVGYAEKTQPAYRAFVEEHKDQVMTVMYDEKHQSGRCVLLEEDQTDPKWLWWTGDLIVEPTESPPKTEEEMENEFI